MQINFQENIVHTKPKKCQISNLTSYLLDLETNQHDLIARISLSYSLLLKPLL